MTCCQFSPEVFFCGAVIHEMRKRISGVSKAILFKFGCSQGVVAMDPVMPMLHLQTVQSYRVRCLQIQLPFCLQEFYSLQWHTERHMQFSIGLREIAMNQLLTFLAM